MIPTASEKVLKLRRLEKLCYVLFPSFVILATSSPYSAVNPNNNEHFPQIMFRSIVHNHLHKWKARALFLFFFMASYHIVSWKTSNLPFQDSIIWDMSDNHFKAAAALLKFRKNRDDTCFSDFCVSILGTEKTVAFN